MELGVIGLGKMGLNLAENMVEQGHRVLGMDADLALSEEAKARGIQFSQSIPDLLSRFTDRKIIWMMLPAGEITESVFQKVKAQLRAGDYIIDGGNAHFEDSKRRGMECEENNIHFFDVGTSGGVSGARNGACMMIGGNEKAFTEIEEVFTSINVEDGYLYAGASGSGHYLKMVHNGVEYGMMQAIGEGFNVLKHAEYDFEMGKVAKVWNNGSVIRSWLMELAFDFLSDNGRLDDIEGVVQSSGEGQWTVQEALKMQVPVPVIAQSLMSRYSSTDEEKYGEKIVASLRNGFGGHAIIKKED
ncbi:6-phosphogluconate dehydrogenase [Alkalibacterium subtropicum]|uniref:6-phosphogluconate dehydrogenase n=1 Tax=Alkalibacterium subtropicum TaxID=753702 RepID=A0A1I1I199_9LACT|nr:decarboxylating 6-phosphogluconate dehydrogenase [Alkalibacterium subtropicum]SFC27000.1 6-phosphogluconate dehydrogenase [Alkalibacterium subtropicum]